MALEDYFKGSSKAYGQLAGSLLASNRKTDKKAIKRSLLATTIAEIFGAAQGKLKQGVIDAANDVKEKYSLIFKDNEELYANESVNRNNYKANFLNWNLVVRVQNSSDQKGILIGICAN